MNKVQKEFILKIELNKAKKEHRKMLLKEKKCVEKILEILKTLNKIIS